MPCPRTHRLLVTFWLLAQIPNRSAIWLCEPALSKVLHAAAQVKCCITVIKCNLDLGLLSGGVSWLTLTCPCICRGGPFPVRRIEDFLNPLAGLNLLRPWQEELKQLFSMHIHVPHLHRSEGDSEKLAGFTLPKTRCFVPLKGHSTLACCCHGLRTWAPSPPPVPVCHFNRTTLLLSVDVQ